MSLSIHIIRSTFASEEFTALAVNGEQSKCYFCFADRELRHMTMSILPDFFVIQNRPKEDKSPDFIHSADFLATCNW